VIAKPRSLFPSRPTRRRIHLSVPRAVGLTLMLVMAVSMGLIGERNVCADGSNCTIAPDITSRCTDVSAALDVKRDSDGVITGGTNTVQVTPHSNGTLSASASLARPNNALVDGLPVTAQSGGSGCFQDSAPGGASVGLDVNGASL
jgi:hypothetical protein